MARSPAPKPNKRPSSAPQAPPLDGDRDTLKSGRWSAHNWISPLQFPDALLLTEADRRLAKFRPGQHLLMTTRLGKHRVELLLRASEAGVDLAMQVPTAPDQYKEPYLLMEAEAGNAREVAVREICFHLQGRVDPVEIERADWAALLKAAADVLEGLRR